MCNTNWYTITCALVLITCGVTQSARILGVVPTPSYSHQIVFKQVWRELSLRGHDVTLITTNPLMDPSLTNLTEIDISFAYDLWENKYNVIKLIDETANRPFEFLNKMIEYFQNIMDEILASDGVQALINDESQHFDLVMVEIGSSAVFAFQHRFNCSLIAISSYDPGSHAHHIVGNPSHPVVNPDVILPFSGELNFWERLTSTLYNNLMMLYFGLAWMDTENSMIRRRFGPDYPTGYELMQRSDMMFINTHPVLHPARALAPATISIGGGIHLEKPKPLPKDLQEYLDSSTNGVIYFSLGSNVKSMNLADDRKQVLMETFASLPYDILWKFEAEDLPGKPDNVRLIKWAPQQDILRHPKILVFISQCGLQSTDEAFFSHIPMVAMPVFADQESNAKSIATKGFGVYIDFRIMTVESLRNTILEVIQNPQYKKRVQDLARLATDEPMTGLEKAIWWTEYVLRNKGNLRHLKSRVVDMPAYQYYLLDVIGFCIGVVAFFCYVMYKAISLIKNKICRYVCKTKIKVQ